MICLELPLTQPIIVTATVIITLLTPTFVHAIIQLHAIVIATIVHVLVIGVALATVFIRIFGI